MLKPSAPGVPTTVATLVAGADGRALGIDTAARQRLFQARCGACHQMSTSRNGLGPTLQGISRRAAGITWTAETFLSRPAAMVRGTRMTQRFGNADERRAIIDFLKAH